MTIACLGFAENVCVGLACVVMARGSAVVDVLADFVVGIDAYLVFIFVDGSVADFVADFVDDLAAEFWRKRYMKGPIVK